MSRLLFLIPLTIFAVAALIARGSGTGPDAVGAGFLALQIYLAGALSWTVSLAVGVIRLGGLRNPVRVHCVAHALVALLYLSPVAVFAWDAYVRERVMVTYELEWRVPDSIRRQMVRYEVAGELGTSSSAIIRGEDLAANPIVSVSGQGYRHIVRLLPNGMPSDSDYTFLLEFPRSIDEGQASDWIFPSKIGRYDDSYEFLKGATIHLDAQSSTTEVAFRYRVESVEKHRGS